MVFVYVERIVDAIVIIILRVKIITLQCKWDVVNPNMYSLMKRVGFKVQEAKRLMGLKAHQDGGRLASFLQWRIAVGSMRRG